MFERFSRSWMLLLTCFDVLRQNNKLALFPFLTLLISILLITVFSFFAGIMFYSAGLFSVLVCGFLMYLVLYFVLVFFNAALVGATLDSLNGGEVSVTNGFAIAMSRSGSLLGYSLFASTVGMALSAIGERTGYAGRVTAGILGVAFNVISFMVLPAIVASGIGPMDAVERSIELTKKCWGESVIGNAGLGASFVIFYVLAVVFGAGGLFFVSLYGNSEILFAIVAALIVCIIISLALLYSALQGIYSVALYLYASEGIVGFGFTGQLLEGAFKKKRVSVGQWGSGNI